MTDHNNKQQNEQDQTSTKVESNSIEMIWEQWIGEVDAWNNRAEKRETALLDMAQDVSEQMKRNRENMKELAEQFFKEQREWERLAREELQASTTMIQYFFPFQSYEEINRSIANFQQKAETAMNRPAQVTQGIDNEKFLNLIEDYIAYRRQNRIQFVKNLKEVSKVIQESQQSVVSMFEKQVKSIFFPFQKYLEHSGK
ncbi:hypothetical protein [Desertibacillus haloalkaliphilus]|uniref:hypothetical protein n=1 Tax=Desertibacillus haloalkaliphilus TaxID=1328930 RepID=UPI001C25E184|nr:hypothetical protein [Desertibacillus haloalkaliphilus]MBU8907553.1 hypothetical protein [Desertibacillus haloalkaliphilus]